MNSMNCREFDEVVHGFLRMELLDVGLREAALDHAACCPQCAERMSEAGTLAELTTEAREAAQAIEAPPRVEAALLDAFRKHRDAAAWRRRFEWAVAGAAAAVLLIGIWSYGSHPASQPGAVPKHDSASRSNAPVAASAQDLPSAAQAAGEMLSASEASAISDHTYAATDFVPIPFTDGISSDDTGTVVRVQLTRASLAELGYPVDEVHAADWIRADVLVGQDGWPRGVRLVE